MSGWPHDVVEVNEEQTRSYAVYVASESGDSEGSGVLFYAGGDEMYVFTCAHVVDHMDRVRLVFLLPLDPARDLYRVFVTDVGKDQVYYPSLDEVEERDGQTIHSMDVAVIGVARPEGFDIEPTNFCMAEPSHHEPLYAQGFPSGLPVAEDAIEYLECLGGVVLASRADKNRFTIRLTDVFIDSSDRVYELKGLSGGPVWDMGEDSSSRGLLGLVSEAQGPTAVRGRVIAAKSEPIRALMKNQFGIVIERRLSGIPDEDVAATDLRPVTFNGSLVKAEYSAIDGWLSEQTSACRQCIDELQFIRAIEVVKEAMADERFPACDRSVRGRLMQHLLYCYEMCDMDAEFDELEEEMRGQGVFEKHDVLRHITRSFGRREFRETVSVAEEYLGDPKTKQDGDLAVIARVYLLLARAYVEELPIEETIGRLLDDCEMLVCGTGDEDDDALLYQMIGYVYGDRYHEYVKSVRLLNRSYRVGSDNIVLESLGAAYYFLGIGDATRDDGTVDFKRLDKGSLYKARKCFLAIMGKADELSWAATVRRVGLCIYNTFVFLNDNYRILTMYPDVKRYVKEIEGGGDWRDVEMKHARVVAQSGSIDLADYPHIQRTDRILLRAIAKSSECLHNINNAIASLRPDQMTSVGLDRYVKCAIREVEGYAPVIEKRDRWAICVQLMNMYGRGMTLFGWDKVEKLRHWLERLRDYDDPMLLESMENYVYEFEVPVEDAVLRFRETYERRKDLVSWQELNNLYIRHGMLDEADEMYRELLTGRRELIEDEPEFAYRSYMDYVTTYRRDMGDALQCFLDAKKEFRDADIESYWELELMFMTNTFNDPERFETERLQFVERNLLGEEEYHRAACIAYMANLDRSKAEEHMRYIERCPHLVNPMTQRLIARKEEIHFLNWVGAIEPAFVSPFRGMNRESAMHARSVYARETWHRTMGQSLRNGFLADRTVAIDAWGLYVLFESGGPDVAKGFDRVYVSHMSVIQLLEELSITGSIVIRDLLELVASDATFKVVSAGFESQIEVRKRVSYIEPAATIALSLERKCLAVVGWPELPKDFVDGYGNSVVRVDEMERLLDGVALL